MDHVCGGSLKSERKVGGGYKVLYMGVSYIVLCSEKVIYKVCYVIGYLGFDRQLGGTSLFFSVLLIALFLFMGCHLNMRYRIYIS